MKEFFGQRLASGKYYWQEIPTPTARNRARQESLRLNFRVESSRRDSALSLVAHDLADQSADWALPLGAPDGPWRIDLRKLALQVSAVGQQTWLDGERVIMPDFDVIESPYEESDVAAGKTAVVRFTLLKDSRAMLTSIPSAQELSGFLDAFRGDHPDLNRCGFLMMPFGNTPAHSAIEACVRSVCSSLNLTVLRADDHTYSDDLFPNIRTYMHACGFGVAVFERLTSEHFNPNVSLEVGYMFALGKPVCLLKDQTLPALPSDLVGRLYEKFDPQRVPQTIPPALRKWLKNKRLAT